MIPVRHAARLVIMSPERRILLFDTDVPNAEDPLRPNTTRFWNTPGGGVEAGETFEQTALRELREETGITDSLIGPCVWTSNRIVCFSDGRRMRFRERFFLVEVPSENVDISRLFGVEADWIKGYRWWSASEIAESDDTFCPEHLAALVSKLATGRIPKLPVCIDNHSDISLPRAS